MVGCKKQTAREIQRAAKKSFHTMATGNELIKPAFAFEIFHGNKT